MTTKSWVSGKLHSIIVTDKSVAYEGSVTICAKLMEAAGIEPYEQVHVVDLRNGNRWVTYAVPGKPGVFTLNGGGALLGEIGDKCVVLAYVASDVYSAARVVHVRADNSIHYTFRYDGL